MAKVQELYDYLKGYGALSESVTVEQFSKEMQSKDRREKLHGYMQQNGFLTKEADFVSFDNALGSRDMTFGENMRHVGGKIKEFADSVVDPDKIEKRDMGQDLKAVADVAKKAPGFIRDSAMAGLYNASAGTVGAVRGVVEPLNRYVAKPVYEAVTGQPGADTDRVSQALGDYQQSIQQSADAVMPKDQTGIASGIASTAQMGANLPLLVMNPAAGLGMMGAQTAGSAYGEAREQGVEPGQAFVHSVSQGAIEIATEKIPAMKLLGDLKQSSGFFKTVVNQLKTEIPGEQIATVLQDLNAWATLPVNRDKPFSAYLAERPSAAGQTAVATIVATGLMSGVATGANRVIQGSPERQVSGAIDRQVDQSVQSGSMRDQLLETAIAGQTQPQVRQAPVQRESMAEKLAKRGVVLNSGARGFDQAVVQQESSGNPNAVNKLSGATGLYQIMPVFLKEGNQLLGTNYSMQDMKNPAKAEQVKNAVHGLWIRQFQRKNGRLPSAEEMAMMHHGGPLGYLKPNAKDAHGISNAEYARQVVARMGQPGGMPSAVHAAQAEPESLPEAPELPGMDMVGDQLPGMGYQQDSSKEQIQVNLPETPEQASVSVPEPDVKLPETPQFETAWQSAKDKFGDDLANRTQNEIYEGVPEADPDAAQKILDKAKVEQAEHEVNTDPTPAQIEAGNYKKGHVSVNGFDITIENPKGSVRSGTDKAGREWSQTIQNTYGYFKRTEGKDGDHVDVFLSDNPTSGNVFVIDQVVDGKFDEHKVMMGFQSSVDARKAYLSNYENGWRGAGDITEMSSDEFKEWLKNGDTKKPVGREIVDTDKMSGAPIYRSKDTGNPDRAMGSDWLRYTGREKGSGSNRIYEVKYIQPGKHSPFKPGEKLFIKSSRHVLREVVDIGAAETKSMGQNRPTEKPSEKKPNEENKMTLEQLQVLRDNLKGQLEEFSKKGLPTDARKEDTLRSVEKAIEDELREAPPELQVQAKPAERPAPKVKPARTKKELGPEYDEVIERIVRAARAKQHRNRIDKRYELLGTDGKWYRGTGFPWGVKSTGERRLIGYSQTSRDGVAVGKLYKTREEAEANIKRIEAETDAELRKVLKGGTFERLRDNAKYWLNEDIGLVKEKPVSLTKEKPEPITGKSNGTTERMGDSGKEPLEGVPADTVQEPEGNRNTGRSGGGSRNADRKGDGRADGGRVPGTRSVGDGEGAVSVPAGRGEPSEEVGQGAGSEFVRGDVQSGDADPTRDSTAGDRSGDRGGAATNRGDGRQVEAQEQAAEESKPTGTTHRPAVKASEVPVEMFTITDAVRIGDGGAKTKFNNNIAAIRLLKKLETEGRPATRDEQGVLALYVGWGGIPQAFFKPDGSVTKGWDDAAKELKGSLSDAEYEAARRSTQDAHYTSRSVVNGIWSAVRQFGFTGGRVLEPSVGTGNFLGLMPVDLRAGSQITAVELDTITGAIAKHLYPGVNIHAPLGFQDAAIADNRFDVAIGNPPFGDQKLYDKKRKHLNKFSIHNYFFAKSVDALRPNGVLAMVVSSRLMDSGKDQARKYIADRTEFLGAIRLPNNAFLKNAGTEVTTDIIFLRKLADSEVSADNQPWLETVMVKDKKGIEIPLNRYFADNPDMMLGEWGAFGSMYGPNEPALVAREGQDTEKLLTEAVGKLPKNIMGASGAPVTRETVVKQDGLDMSGVKDSGLFVHDDTVYRKTFDPDALKYVAERVSFANKKVEGRVKGMVAVRDAFASLRSAQLDDTVEDKQLEFLRQKLNAIYDRFVKENGPINSQANKSLFRQDPTWPQVSALEENFDKGISPAVAKSTGEKSRVPSAKKAAIFFKRTQSPYKPVTMAATAKDALSASLSEVGRIDFERMGALYGKSKAEMINELGPLVFEDPVSGWVTRDEYLSGNVKRKLAQARDAAKLDSRFDRNVEELKEVIPADVEAVDIVVRLGGHWIPPSDMSDFAAHLTGNPRAKASYDAISAKWSFSESHPSDAAQAEFGTARKYADSILEAVANSKQIVVNDKDADGKSYVNKAETAAANDKAERIKERFSSWIWQSDERRERLAKLYNDIFNTDRQREYDGSHLSFPGKISDDIVKLRPHQANAVWRCLQGGTTLLDHVVGAGKTFTMIATAMEMRRMGRAKKPVFVVPNHLVGQWAADFVKLYPGANILAATKQDFEAQNRKRFFSRIATGDWDAVVVAHSSFKLLASSPEFEREFIEMQIRDIEISIENLREADGKDSRSVKQQEKQRDKLRSKLARLLDSGSKDDNLNFAELGIDALFVDEAHEFKNLSFSTSMTRVGGLNPAGSQRASDMFSKTMFVQRLTGGRNVVFATGTPISNTMAEMYTMQRYLQYKTMQDQGVAHFDAWARMYGEVVSDWELSPAGKYVMRSRFSRFVNIPELMQQYLSFADVISRDDINRQLAAQGKKLPVPEMVSGKPVNVVVDRSADQADYIGEPITDKNGNEVYPEHSLVYRSENLPRRPAKGEDNMLVIMGLARKAALDMRLIDPAYPDDPGSKVNEAARRIKEQYDQWDHVKGAQLVFCDLSTPSKSRGKESERIGDLLRRADEGDEDAVAELDKIDPDELAALESKFSVYDDLKAKLVKMGIKESEVAFIHDANTEQQKEDLFGKVRSGRVRVLMGSTQKMGAGMNVQERLVALHHLDAPWRPSDLEQREGRIIRQGNVLYDADPEGFRVFVGRYATKNTLDSRMWQTIETKARFIEQIKKGGTSERVIEDIGGEAANAAEMKAAASGNPLILEEMTLRQKAQKLNQQKTNHDREQHRIKDSIRIKKKALVRMDGELPDMKADAETAAQIGQEFAIQVGKKVFDKRQEAGEALVAAAKKIGSAKPVSIGSIGGFSITVHTNDLGHNKLSVSGKNLYTPKSDVDLSSDDLSKEQKGGIATQIFNVARTVPGKEFDATRSEIKRIETDIPALEKQIRAWEHQKELVEVKLRHAAVIRELQPKSEQKAQSEDAGDDISAMASATPMPGWVPPLSAAGFPARPADGKVKIGDRTVDLPEEDKPVRVEQIRLMAEQLIGRGLYFGKIKLKNTAGFHRRKTGEVRMANYNDVETLAHEISHFLGDSNKGNNPLHKLYTDKRFSDELKALSYTSADGKALREGFAEYMRLWFTQYDMAKQAAPKFTEAFDKFLADDKRTLKAMTWMQDAMHKWVSQGDAARFEAFTSGNQFTPMQKLTMWVAQRPVSLMRQQYIDHLHAAKLMGADVYGKSLRAEDDPYKQLQLINGVEGIVQESFIHGAPYIADDGSIKFEGPSLELVFKKSLQQGMKNLRAQEKYFVARRAAELKMQGRENLLSVAQIKIGLALADKYPWFKKSFSDYQKYRENLLAFMVDCGYLEERAAKKFMEVNRNYVPFNREVEGIGQSFAGSGNFKRLKGGTQNLKHVYDNILLGDAQHIKAALRARAMRELYSTALQHEDGGKWIAPLGKDARLVKTNIEQQAKVIADAMAALGMTVADGGRILSGDPAADTITDVEDIQKVLLQDPELMQFWTFGHKPSTTETGVDSFIDPNTGVRRWVEIQRDNELLLDMVNGMAGTRLPDGLLGVAYRLAAAVKQIQTMTITAAWQFAGPNIVRDMQQAFILSGGKFRPVVDNVYGLASMLHDLVKRDGWYHEMKAQGGGWSGRVRSIMTDTWEMERGAMAPKTRSKYHPARVAQGLLDVLMSIGDSAEMSTRVGFYIRMRKSGVGAREAAWQAREISTDFRKHGSYAPWVMLQRVTPFLGAFIQGADRDIRALAEMDGRMSVKNIVRVNRAKARIYAAGGAMITAAMLIALMNDDDERYRDLTPDQKTRFFHFFVGDQHFTVPKPHGFFSLMAAAGEAIVDTMKGQSGDDAGKFMAFALAYQLGADVMPGFVNPVYELAVNKSFTGAPIIGERLKGLSPEMQFTDRTPGLYIAIGQKLGVAPDAVHHLVRGYTGYVSDFLNEASERALWNREQWGARPFEKDAGDFIGKQFVQKRVPYRTKWTEKYYDLRRRASEKEASLSRLQKAPAIRDRGMLDRFAGDENSMKLAAASKAFRQIDKAFSDQEMRIASIKYDPYLLAEEKEQRIDAYYEQKNGLLKNAYRQIEEALN
ncbi:MAG: DEAD/DEAH box helicase family protein [Chlorobium sp.]|uniref:LPD38 domain-containing protein n=1 Tax=Chlorobium sp. TaxID=1095 RepID=UPI002F41E0A8